MRLHSALILYFVFAVVGKFNAHGCLSIVVVGLCFNFFSGRDSLFYRINYYIVRSAHK